MKQRGIAYAWIVLAAGTVWASNDMETTRLNLEKWLETRRLIAREEQEWRVGKELLQERIDLIRKACEALREKIETTRKESAETAGQLAALRKRNETLKTGMTPLHHDIKGLELRTLAILPWTPEPVRQRVAPLSQRIPANPKDSKLTVTERFQNVIGTLNELNKSARELAVSGEVRKLADGRQAEVTVFYIGLSQAYYVNAKSGVAGIGMLGPEGTWAWHEDNRLAGVIEEALGIYRGERPAAYVALPVSVK